MSIIDKVKEILSNTAERLQSIPKQRHAKMHETMGDVKSTTRDTFEDAKDRLGEETGRREGPGDITGGTGEGGPR
ncbi:hypothetical protein [Microtetraspora malaysiensis]|uniref:hypothetical protein n=1 Tax=Microtetraspora malaysiensis TaxID=161358 RepID=UPI003D8B7727